MRSNKCALASLGHHSAISRHRNNNKNNINITPLAGFCFSASFISDNLLAGGCLVAKLNKLTNNCESDTIKRWGTSTRTGETSTAAAVSVSDTAEAEAEAEAKAILWPPKMTTNLTNELWPSIGQRAIGRKWEPRDGSLVRAKESTRKREAASELFAVCSASARVSK